MATDHDIFVTQGSKAPFISALAGSVRGCAGPLSSDYAGDDRDQNRAPTFRAAVPAPGEKKSSESPRTATLPGAPRGKHRASGGRTASSTCDGPRAIAGNARTHRGPAAAAQE